MKKRLHTCRFILLLGLMLFVKNTYGQDNPLFSSSTKQDSAKVNNSEKTIKKREVSRNPGKYPGGKASSNFIKTNARMQKKIKSKFFSLAHDYQEKKSKNIIFLIFFFSFLYGILHSLGPGHGKVFIFSYILTEDPKIPRAIGISYLIATAHAISGLIVALIVVFTLNTYSSSSAKISETSNFIMAACFALIILLGIGILVKAIRPGKHHEYGIADKKRLIPFILSVGIVPCPGIIIIVTFLASLSLLYIGIASVVFIILGMGFTISAIGLISLFSKQLVLRLFPKNSETYEKIYRDFSIAGALLLIFFGTWFLIGSFY